MKNLLRIALASLLWLSAAWASANSFTVRFKRPASWTSTPHIHAWYNNTVADNQAMRTTSDADWFEYTLDTDSPVHLIFNNGGWGNGNNQSATLYSQLPYDMCLTCAGSGAEIRHTTCPEDEESPLTVLFKRPEGWDATPHLHLYRQANSHSNRVIYEITVLNYSAAGTFNALTADLDRIQALGVNTLWLMPIFQLGELGKVGAYGSPYAIRNYRAVNPAYGTLEDFKALVNAAHSRGMEVWLDIACNHTSKDHAWVNGHPDYYASENGQRPYSPNGWNDVYQLDFQNQAMCHEMIENLKYWVRECNIDGYRCDYASGIPIGFWMDAAREVSKIKTVYWLAENDDAAYTAAFDGDYAWAFYSRLIEFAANPDVAQLISQCQNLYNDTGYRQKNKLIHLTNHDRSAYEGSVESRFGNYYKPLLVLSFTIFDTPMLYNGQEIGWTVSSFTDKQAIQWNNANAGIARLTSRLCALKSSAWALKDAPGRGTLSNLNASSASVYAYQRSLDDDAVVVLLNLSGNAVSFSLGTQPEGTFEDVLDDATGIRFSAGQTLQLPAYGYAVYHKKGGASVQSGDLTFVNDAAMQPSAYEGWYSYTTDQLAAGSACTLIFNNGGWSGGQTADYGLTVSDSYCFTSTGSGAAVTEIPCPTTGLSADAEPTQVFRIYSNQQRIAGSFCGRVQVYTLTGETVQVIDAAGAFHTQVLSPGIYLVALGSHICKIAVAGH